ncbi:hypothetical protein [Lapillicoccus sp.]|uniref:cupredoxin domain-containing protein n=1 Tax=Lapillicoccus sp. TaxID=1909287 RepID=UPI003983D392
MRPLVLAVPVALLSLVGACGSSSTPANGPAAAASSAPSSAPSSSSSSGGGAAAGVLTGSVGEGDAYVITLMDSTGAPVTSLKAGSYTVKVKDASKIHDFHLSGPGVDQKTTVPEVTEASWTVTLQAGTYTYKCDPHPKMTGSFTVT